MAILKPTGLLVLWLNKNLRPAPHANSHVGSSSITLAEIRIGVTLLLLLGVNASTRVWWEDALHIVYFVKMILMLFLDTLWITIVVVWQHSGIFVGLVVTRSIIAPLGIPHVGNYIINSLVCSLGKGVRLWYATVQLLKKGRKGSHLWKDCRSFFSIRWYNMSNRKNPSRRGLR